MKKTLTYLAKLTVEIRSRGETFNGEVWRAIVTTARGRCYCCDWVGRKPSEEEVIQTWRDDRRAFEEEEWEQASREHELELIALTARDMLKPILTGEIERGHCSPGSRECYGAEPGMRKTTLADARKIVTHVTAYINRKLNDFHEKNK